MLTSGQDVMDRAERVIAELVHDTNESAAAARTAWLFFMALIAFFVIALAGVDHKDLLLETPVELPLLQVKIPQASFFLFGPLILVLVHLSLLMQHVTLARKLQDVHDRLTKHEGNNFYRQHRLRGLVHSYAMAQTVAGPVRSPVLGFFLHAMNWITLVLLPILVLINFQTTYLPLHDAFATNLHRIYLAIDILILALLGLLIKFPNMRFRGAFVAGLTNGAAFTSALVALVALCFSLLVATIPDEPIDRMMADLMPAKIVNPAAPEGAKPRTAFWPTTLLFEGPTDEILGRPSSPMSRNLVVINTPLVAPVNPEPDDASLSLRGRDLKYATFDRSDMRRVDFTGADLTGASLFGTILIKARLSRATMTNADMRWSGLISTWARGTKFENTVVCSDQRYLLQTGLPANEEIKGLVKQTCTRDR